MTEKTILLANRDRDSLHITREFLERKGLATVVASTVDEALRNCGRYKPHLAILDIRLQDETDERDLSGLELAKRLRQQNMIPAIILTLVDANERQHQRFVSEMRNVSAVVFVRRQDGLPALYEALLNLLDH